MHATSDIFNGEREKSETKVTWGRFRFLAKCQQASFVFPIGSSEVRADGPCTRPGVDCPDPPPLLSERCPRMGMESRPSDVASRANSNLS